MKKIQKIASFLMIMLSLSMNASQWKALLPSKNMARVAAVAAGCAMTVQNPTHNELLIVKKDKQGLAPLSDLDAKKYGPVISQTLLKYQWPMCTSQDLTDQEKNELLTADKQCAEELFIEKKLQERIGSDDFDPAVIFIPTTLYELFCLDLLSKEDEVLSNENLKIYFNLHNLLIKEIHDMSRFILLDYENLDLQLDVTMQTIGQSVRDKSRCANKRFFNDDNNVGLYVNQLLIEWLFEKYPELKLCKNALDASTLLEKKSEDISLGLSKDGIYLAHERCNALAVRLVMNRDRAMIHDFLRIEYEARQQNKALLVRGSGRRNFELEVDGGKMQTVTLIANTLNRTSDDVVSMSPYSISFGNSLFAGSVFDYGACAYNYLTRGEAGTKGYVLSINKKDYINNRNSHLFFIPALHSIAALKAQGEFFHPRGTAAVDIKNKDAKSGVLGLHSCLNQDHAQVIKIERDPLLHAELFSDFVAKNGRIIQYSDDRDLTEQDKQAAEQILKNQAVAAQAYRKMREDAARLNAEK